MKPGILIYCQYLVGIGHLVRTVEIIRHLVPDCRIGLVGGGQPTEFPLPMGVEAFELPALWVDRGKLKACDSADSLKSVKKRRKKLLLACFESFQPDCLVTEMFPFSKRKMAFELLPLLDYAKSTRPEIPIVCSLRDIFMAKPVRSEKRARKEALRCAWANRYYDLVLHHSDPRVHSMRESLFRASRLECEVRSTGFVAQTLPAGAELSLEDQAALGRPEPMIIVSAGGGRFAGELEQSVVRAAEILEGAIPHHFHLFSGPFAKADDLAALERCTARLSNVSVRRFTPHLPAYMARAELSISLGGYNTTMNILSSQVRCLIYPFAQPHQAAEQGLRARKLERLGLLEVLDRESLAPRALAKRITEALGREPATHDLDLRGAERSAFYLKNLLFAKGRFEPRPFDLADLRTGT